MSKKDSLTIKLDYRILSLVLALVILTMLFLWRPWTSADSSSQRTISTIGTASVESEPDSFVFYPSYNLEAASYDEAIAKTDAKSKELISGLTALGVAESDIKSQTTNFDYSWLDNRETDAAETIYFSMTVNVDNKELTQKVQDFLLTTGVEGQISPAPQFSEAKMKELKQQARDLAIQDARAQADKDAKLLDEEIDKVISVSDAQDGGIIAQPYALEGEVRSSDISASIGVLPGTDKVYVSVKVQFSIK